MVHAFHGQSLREYVEKMELCTSNFCEDIKRKSFSSRKAHTLHVYKEVKAMIYDIASTLLVGKTLEDASYAKFLSQRMDTLTLGFFSIPLAFPSFTGLRHLTQWGRSTKARDEFLEQ